MRAGVAICAAQSVSDRACAQCHSTAKCRSRSWTWVQRSPESHLRLSFQDGGHQQVGKRMRSEGVVSCPEPARRPRCLESKGTRQGGCSPHTAVRWHSFGVRKEEAMLESLQREQYTSRHIIISDESFSIWNISCTPCPFPSSLSMA